MDSLLKCRIAYNKYGGYCVPLSSKHRPASKKILSGKVYEPDTIKYIMENNYYGDIIHAGTFFGDFLPALSNSISPNSKIWAYEPNTENYRCAVITIYINNIKNVEIRNVALGKEYGELPLIVADKKGKALGGMSRIMRKGEDINPKHIENITVVPIDKAIPIDRNISIIHLDVEYQEKNVLIGAMETIKRNKPIIILEVVPEDEWMKENIYSLGYKKVRMLHTNTVFIS